MGFLSKHCQLTWQIAVHNCKLIFDGLTDLEQRKQFISSFQNAVELCLKQYLIDKNDIFVLHGPKMSSGPKLIIYNNCMLSTDYNSFFSGLSISDLEEVYSSDFSAIVRHIFGTTSIHCPSYYHLVNPGFDLLIKLRNTETHFFIDENNYLSIDEFKKLCNLMKILQKFFVDNSILEKSPKNISETNVKYLGYFNEKINKASSYGHLVKIGKSNNMFLNQLEDFISKKERGDYPLGWMFYVEDVNDLYTIAHEIYEHHGIDDPDLVQFDFLMNFNEFYRRFVLMVENKLICIDKET